MEKGTNPKPDKSIRSAIKFATKAVKTLPVRQSCQVMSEKLFVLFSTCSLVTRNLRNVKFYLYGVFRPYVANLMADRIGFSDF